MRYLIAAMLVLSSPAGAQPKTWDWTNPNVVAEALRETGYKAVLKKNDKGEPLIESAANGSSFTIDFYGCEKGRCSSMGFYTWYKKEPSYNVQLVNQWNAEKRFLKAYIDKDGDLATTMDVATIGPVTQESFADWVDWWSVMTGELFTFLKQKSPPTK